MDYPYFPMFIDLSGKQIIVFGGGIIAYRRVSSLMKFCSSITVIAPKLCDDLILLINNGVNHIVREYIPGDTAGADIVVCATNSRSVNHQIYLECKDNSIAVNIADCKEECSFYFPGVVVCDNIVIGITASGSDHKLAKEVRMNIEDDIDKIIKGRGYEESN